MSQLGVILQESLRAEREARTILGLLTHQMDGGGVDREEEEEEEVEEGPRRRRSLKDRLRFTGMGCCGATWVFRPLTLTVRHAQEQEEGAGGPPPPPPQQQLLQETNPGQAPNPSGPDCVGPSPAGSGMNLATALAAERQFRGSQEPERDSGGEGSRGENLGSGGSSTVPETPLRVSLMRLLEETEEKEKGGGAVGNDSVCCVCMGRKKGAAFIPCGHTFCRVCSRELWLNRGTCPLCNCSILEILDIF